MIRQLYHSIVVSNWLDKLTVPQCRVLHLKSLKHHNLNPEMYLCCRIQCLRDNKTLPPSLPLSQTRVTLKNTSSQEFCYHNESLPQSHVNQSGKSLHTAVRHTPTDS